MNLKSLCVSLVLVATFFAIDVISIDHDKVQPFAEPEPVTVSEKAAIKFKPQLAIVSGCVSFAAVNAAGETNGGLKGTGGETGCKVSLLGSQVYGRAMWHNDVWAIMYAWYFPKGFWDVLPSRRHDWASAVIWIDNPAFETPKVLGLSTSIGDNKYSKDVPPPVFETGTRKRHTTVETNVTIPRLRHSTGFFGQPVLGHSSYFNVPLEEQDLIMWEQLTDEARAALEKTDFGKAKVPFNDANFQDKLEKAWPF